MTIPPGPVIREAPTPGAPRYRHGPQLRATVTDHLRRFEHRPMGGGDALRPAAVALTLVDGGDGEASVVLTRRASSLRSHAGQWALPGGRVDADEDPVDAARRELAEEVGLVVTPDEIVGCLDPYPTRSGYLIQPVVVWGADASTLAPNPDEVASVHLVPLGELDRPDSPRFISIPESTRPVVQVPLLGDLIHAPTAAVLYQLREVALHGRHTRVDHLEQPVWAWR